MHSALLILDKMSSSNLNEISNADYVKMSNISQKFTSRCEMLRESNHHITGIQFLYCVGTEPIFWNGSPQKLTNKHRS